jgi:hypothetical protein
VELHAQSCQRVRHDTLDTCTSSWSLTLSLADDGRFTCARADPASAVVDRLAGTPLQGLRRRLTNGELGSGIDPLLVQLLDDLSVVVMTTGYGRLRDADERVVWLRPGTTEQRRFDVCAGWAKDGELADTVRRGRPFRLTETRLVEEAELEPWCSHTGRRSKAAVAPGGQSRRRLLRAHQDEQGCLHASARLLDTYVESDGRETVLHEYDVEMRVNAASGAIEHVRATPGSLPTGSCAGAAASASLVMGTRIGALRGVVHERLAGPHTCTHLNDVLRSFSGLGAWLEPSATYERGRSETV